MEFVLDDMVTVLGEGGVADPQTDPKMPGELAVKLFKHMLLMRALDERLVTLQRQGRIGFHIGSMGEEASILGSTAAMRDVDWVFPCYREFGALLWRGMPLQRYIDNMFGNSNDPVHGRQMPDHYSGKAHHFGSVSSPIGTQITQGVGFAWAAKLRHDDLVTLSYFGEGATSSNEFHCGANFAGVFKTPSILFCRNNGWAISVPAHKQTASKTFAQKGFAYGLRPVRVDGTDLLAVWKVTREAVERARQGEPTLIESVSVRLSGHSTSDDPKAYRKEADMIEERKKDPLPRMRAYLEREKLWDVAAEKAWGAEVDAMIKAAVDAAEKTAPPALETLFSDVYGEMPWHLREQLEQARRAPRGAGH